MHITDEIKAYALQLGFCKIGVTNAQKYDRVLAEAVARGGYDYWLDRFRQGSDPKILMPDAKSVIVLAYDYARCHFPENLLPMIGRAYLSRSYSPQPGSAVHRMLMQFENCLKEKGIRYVTGNELLVRPAAEQAGVTSFGKNNFAYVDGVGSFIILYGYIVDKALEYDPPFTGSRCPPKCRACIDACPTHALYAPFKLDPEKCIGYNNWMRHAGRINDLVIPREIRPQMDRHIHGCDLCQEACPRNKRKLAAEYPKDALLEDIGRRFRLQDLLHMPEGFYEKCVHPIMYNYIRDKKVFQRNAAVAIGNTQDPAYIPDLIAELSNPDAVIRLHVVWALGQMDDPAARRALYDRIQIEASPAVIHEIKMALAAETNEIHESRFQCDQNRAGFTHRYKNAVRKD